MSRAKGRQSLRAAAFALVLAAGVASGATADDDGHRPWAATFWGGWGSDGHIEDLPGITSEFEKSWFAGIGLTRQFARSGEHLAWEVEAVVVKHFGWQRHWEGDLAVALRRDGISLSESLHSSVAVATGLSYASRLPVLEQAIDPETKKLLQFLALEIDFARPERPELAVVLRLHHRSSAFGLYGIDSGGSNFVALGLRRRF